MNFEAIKKRFLKLTFFKSDQIEFLDDFQELVDSGLEEKAICLNFMKYGTAATKCLASEMTMAIRNGKKITVAMEGWFSPLVISTIAAGKETGDMVMGLNIGSSVLRDASGLTSDIFKAVIYPLSILAVIVGISGGPAYEYLLTTQETLPLHRWGAISHTAWNIANFCHNWKFVVLFGMLAVIALLTWVLPNVPDRGDLDKAIIFKQYRDLNAIAVLASVSSLMKAGVSLKDCLSIIGQGSGRWLSAKLRAAKLKITSGKKNYGDIFDVGLVNEPEIQRIKILSNSEDIPSVLMKSSERQRRKLKKQIARLAFLANALAMLMAGMGLAIMAGGAYLVVAQSARIMS